MKYSAIISLIALMVVIAGCAPAPAPADPAPTQQVPAPGFEDVEEMVVVTGPPVEPSRDSREDYSISDETMAKIEKNFGSTTKWHISETFRKIDRGDHHTFAIAFRNRMANKDNFLISVEFKRAYDRSSNSIESVDEAQIATWLVRNDWPVTPLDVDEDSIQSIIIEIKDLADGTSPPAGTYEFDVNVLAQMGLFEVTEEYSGDITIAIQVV